MSTCPTAVRGTRLCRTSRRRTRALWFCALAAAPLGAQAPTDSSPRLTWGGFLDTYIAWDTNRPPARDRQFTTQPARHAEFNVNLAHVHATLAGERVRGRLALQAGTSVQSNYASEPTEGVVSGPDVSRLLQEAYVGLRLSPTLWLDAGVFYSNAGLEAWESDQNPTYTRSLVADYSPYYSSGARLQWQASQRVSARLDVLNGWQNISETNSAKAIGTRVDVMGARTGLSWYTFAGEERDSGVRLFTGIGGRLNVTPRFTLLGQYDLGSEPRAAATGRARWRGGVVIARYTVTEEAAFVGRVERYADPEQVILGTGTADGFVGNGGSIGLDVRLPQGALWRTEARALRTRDVVFTGVSGATDRNAVLVTSLSMRF